MGISSPGDELCLIVLILYSTSFKDFDNFFYAKGVINLKAQPDRLYRRRGVVSLSSDLLCARS